ncbi:Tyrosine-protein kinase ephrin type A/B receptor-like protein [Gracilaria domingensis]|nr:Tyrosine-protein kinase ephrin type A/B receptor-like protein [Gracilaria domingensis]
MVLLMFVRIDAQDIGCFNGQVRDGDSGNCRDCPPGTYADPLNGCIPCPSGTFQPFFGVGNSRLCRQCFENTFSQEGSRECKPCPPGLVSRRGSSSCTFCPLGRFLQRFRGVDSCADCFTRSFKNRTDTLDCDTCPDGTTSSLRGSRSISDCFPCAPNRDRRCNECRENSYKPLQEDECRSCPDGTFTNSSGALGLSECMSCPPNMTFTDGECTPCPPGTFANRPGADMCRHIDEPCETDFFRNAFGDCQTCPTGWRYDSDSRTCQICPPGHVSKGGLCSECVKCENNLHPSPSRHECGCREGHFLDKENNLCVECWPGSFASQSFHKRLCLLCHLGTFTNSRGSRRCEECPPGLAAPFRGATECVPCPNGTTPSPQEHSGFGTLGGGRFSYEGSSCLSTRSGCLPTERLVEDESGSFCTTFYCGLDTPVEEVGVTCTPCEEGFLVNDEGTDCVQCPPGTISRGGLATECSPCQNGLTPRVVFFEIPGLRGVFNRYPAECVCARRNFGMQDGECRPCPPGTGSSYQRPFIEYGPCVPCPPGTFWTAEDGCSSCARGTTSESGALSCFPLVDEAALQEAKCRI